MPSIPIRYKIETNMKNSKIIQKTEQTNNDKTPKWAISNLEDKPKFISKQLTPNQS